MDSLVEGLDGGAWNINSLPEEILINIFGYLSHNELGRIARVCRIWHLLTKSHILWKKVNVKFSPSHGSQNTVAKHFVNLLPLCVTCIKLDFTCCRYWGEFLHFEELCVKLQESCPHLKILILVWAKLSISLPSVIDVSILFLQNGQLLTFRNSEFVRKEWVLPSKIEILELSGSSLGDSNKAPFSRMMYLKQLFFTDINIDISWFKDDISFLKQFEVLDIGETWIDSRTFQAIRNHALSLKKLYLCLAILKDKDFIFDNSVFPNLEAICLNLCSGVTSEGIVSLIQSCQSLENVYDDKDLAASYAEHPFVIVNKCNVCRIWHVLTRSSILWKKVNVKFSPSHGSQSTVTNHFVNMLPPCVTCIKLDFTRRRYWIEILHFEEFCIKLQESCPHLKMLILVWAKLSISLPSVIDVCTHFLQKVQILAFRNSEFSNCSVKREWGGPSKLEILDLSGSSLGHFNKPPFSRMMYLKQLYLTDTNVDYSWFEDDISFLKRLEVLDMGETWIDSRTFQAIRNHALSLKKLYLCLANLEDNDFIFDNSVFPNLETICLRYFNDGTSESVVSLIRSCQSLQNVYVDKDLAASYAEHPFVIVNKCKLGIVKIIDCCYSHRNDNYLCEYMI